MASGENVVLIEEKAVLVFRGGATCMAVADRLWPKRGIPSPWQFFLEPVVHGVWRVTSGFILDRGAMETPKVDLTIFDRKVLTWEGDHQFEVQGVMTRGDGNGSRVIKAEELAGLSGDALLPIYPDARIEGSIQVIHHSFGGLGIRTVASERIEAEKLDCRCVQRLNLPRGKSRHLEFSYAPDGDVTLPAQTAEISEPVGPHPDALVWEIAFRGVDEYCDGQRLAQRMKKAAEHAVEFARDVFLMRAQA